MSSSRVLAAPGGKSEMGSLLGGATAEDRKAALLARRNAAQPALAETTNVVSN